MTGGGVERGVIDVASALVQEGWRAIVASAGGPQVRDLLRAGATHVTLPIDARNPFLFARNPGWHFMLDVDPVAAEATRRKVYDMLVAERMLVQGWPEGMLLNLNVPPRPLESIGPLRWCRNAVRRYTDPEYHRLEVERVWKKVWQMACREEQIPEPGDFIVYDIVDTSVLVVRTESGRVAAFYKRLGFDHYGGPGSMRMLLPADSALELRRFGTTGSEPT